MSAAKRKPAQPDPREALLNARPGRNVIDATPAVIDDLRYFRQQLDKTGRTVSITGMIDYFAQHRNFRVGAKRLCTIAKQAGIEPWWKP